MDKFEIELNNGNHIRVYRGKYTPVNSNMYIIIKKREAIVIDPNENEEIRSLFTANRVGHVFIILTHEHYDHISGVCWLQESYNCTLICNEKCLSGLDRQGKDFPRLVALVLSDKDKIDGGHRYEDFKKNYKPFKLIPDIIYKTPCEFEVLGLNFRGVQTPGHSPGSWCLVVNDRFVITGDTLIKDTPIVIRFNESRKNDFFNITLPYLRNLNSELLVLPGHFDPFVLRDNNILHTYTSL